MHSFLTDGVLSLRINVLYVYEEGFKRANDIITRDPQLSSRCPIPTPPVHLIRSRRVVETTPVAKSSSSIHRGESADLPDEAGGDGTTRSPSVSPDGPPRALLLLLPMLASSAPPLFLHAGWPLVTRRLLLLLLRLPPAPILLALATAATSLPLIPVVCSAPFLGGPPIATVFFGGLDASQQQPLSSFDTSWVASKWKFAAERRRARCAVGAFPSARAHAHMCVIARPPLRT